MSEPAESDERSLEFEFGERVRDAADADPTPAIVVELPAKPAGEWVAYERGGEPVTVADDNPSYPAEGPVVVVAFEPELAAEYGGRWRTWAAPVGGLDVRTYSFPAGRVEPWPETCGFCGRGAGRLYAHQLVRHGSLIRALAPLDCPICGRRFDTERGLKTHASRGHGAVRIGNVPLVLCLR